MKKVIAIMMIIVIALITLPMANAIKVGSYINKDIPDFYNNLKHIDILNDGYTSFLIGRTISTGSITVMYWGGDLLLPSGYETNGQGGVWLSSHGTEKDVSVKRLIYKISEPEKGWQVQSTGFGAEVTKTVMETGGFELLYINSIVLKPDGNIYMNVSSFEYPDPTIPRIADSLPGEAMEMMTNPIIGLTRYLMPFLVGLVGFWMVWRLLLRRLRDG